MRMTFGDGAMIWLTDAEMAAICSGNILTRRICPRASTSDLNSRALTPARSRLRLVRTGLAVFLNETLSKAETFLFNFVVNPKQGVFARRLLPNAFHDNPMPQQKQPSSTVGGWGRNPTHESVMNTVRAN